MVKNERKEIEFKIRKAASGTSLMKSISRNIRNMRIKGGLGMKQTILQKLEVLLLELESLQGIGITIWLEGSETSPLVASNAIMVNEENNYMRDYVMNERGKVTELRFNKIEYK